MVDTLTNPVCRSDKAGVFAVSGGFVIVPVSEVEGQWLGDPDTQLQFESWPEVIELFKAVLRCKAFADASARLFGPELSQFFKWLPKPGEPAEDRHIDGGEAFMGTYLPNYPNEGKGWYGTLRAGEITFTFEQGKKGSFLSSSSARTPNPLWKDAEQLLIMASQGVADARTDLYCYDPVWDLSTSYGPFLAPALAKLGIHLKPIPDWLNATLASGKVESQTQAGTGVAQIEPMSEPLEVSVVVQQTVSAPESWRDDAKKRLDERLSTLGY